MSGPARFAFKPALLRGALDYELQGDTLVCTDAEGTLQWQVDLRQLDQAGFVTHTLSGTHMWRFDLTGQDGTKRSVSLNFPVKGADQNPDRATFLALLAILAETLDRHQPDLPITLADTGAARWGFFAIGALSALGGIGLFAVALATGVASSRLPVVGLASGLLTLLGAVFVYAYRPWAQPPYVRPAEMLRRLQVEDQADDHAS